MEIEIININDKDIEILYELWKLLFILWNHPLI